MSKVHTENDYIMWHDDGLHHWVFKKKKLHVLPDEVDWIWLCPDLAFIVTRPNISGFFLWVYVKNIIVCRDKTEHLTLGHHITEVTAAVTCYALEQMEGAYHFDGFQATNIAHIETWWHQHVEKNLNIHATEKSFCFLFVPQ